MTQDIEGKGKRTVSGGRFGLILGVIVGLGLIVGVVYSSMSTRAGSTTGKSDPEDSKTPGELRTYQAGDDICEAVDYSHYETIVGQKPTVESEDTDDSGDTAKMTCWLRVDDVDQTEIRLHNLGIVVEVLDSSREAKAAYNNALASSHLDGDNTDPVEGPWSEAVTYKIDDVDDGYGFDAYDGNAKLRFTQSIDPLDSVSKSDARDLMKEYSKEILAELRK